MSKFIPKVITTPLQRKILKSPGTLIIFLITLGTITLWLFSKGELQSILDYPLLSFGQLCGLTGLTFLCINFMLATRVGLLEKLFGGLDRVYKIHDFTGRNAFILLCIHPLLVADLTQFFGKNFGFGIDITQDFGKIALTLLSILIVLTVFIKLPYHIWKSTHKFMALPLFFAGLHAMTIASDIKFYLPLRYYMLGLIIIAGLAYTYKIFLYRYIAPKIKAIVEEVKMKNDVAEIYLKPLKNFVFNPGQFIFVTFRNSKNVSKESHPFTISSAPGSESLRISPKNSGDFTSTLSKLEKGTEVIMYGPHGRFADKFITTANDMIWIAGGIGITPFLSMLSSDHLKKNNRMIDLFYCYTEAKEAVYSDEINQKIASNENIKLHEHCSNDKGRINVEIIADMIKDFKNRTIFLCGPSAMMNDLANQFIKVGIKPTSIYFEEFALI